MRTHVVCAALVAVVLPASAAAQTLTLTEEQALARLSPEGPWTRAARSAVDLARADVLVAGRWPNPRVVYNREAVVGVAETMVTVAQVLPLTGRRGLELRAAEALVDATASRADAELRRVRADVRLAFAALVAAQARERELAQSRARLQELADRLARREAAGDAAGFDRLRAEREVSDVDVAWATAATERARAQAALVALLDLSLDARVEAATPVNPPAPVPPLEVLVARAEERRPEIAAYRYEIVSAGLTGDAARRSLVPEPEVVGGTKSSSLGGGDVGSVISVHVTVPLFDRARPERAHAEARALQAQAHLDVFRRRLQAEIAAWRAAVIERRETAARYRASAATADRIASIADVSYDAGERGILELLDAHRTAAAARVRQVDLDAAVRDAEIELELASGWEMR